MKIIIDNKIPFIKGALEPFAEVLYLEGQEIKRTDVADADALIIRTRTQVNEELLGGSRVKFVGTATIGTDHIDLDWCRNNNIYCASAPGCNSGSVMQYLASSLVYLSDKYGIEPSASTLGVIGDGNVGSKVASMASTLGYRVLLNDPPREEKEGSSAFTALEILLKKSDIISLHVPLEKEGKYPTFRMVDKHFLNAMKTGSILINTSRGPVVDEKALAENLKSHKLKAAVLDVWDNEPGINRELLKLACIATPHIAGYSLDGKANGTSIIIKEIADFFNLPLKEWKPLSLPVPGQYLIETGSIDDAIIHTYNVKEDSDLLKSNPGIFEELRGNYRNRREFGAYKVKTADHKLLNKLKSLGFDT
jgi:erythronate-4-phosphate dehydrogenase